MRALCVIRRRAAALFLALLSGVRATAAEQASAAAPPARAPQDSAAAVPESASAASTANESDPLSGRFVIEPRGVLVVNTAYANHRLLPGSYVLFAVQPEIRGDQFVLSPSNTTVGFGISGVSFHHVELSGALDVTLRAATDPGQAKALQPQFYRVELSARGEWFVLRIGHLPDVILPFIPLTTNLFPATYMPGHLGSGRPQLRLDLGLALGGTYELALQTSLSRPV